MTVEHRVSSRFALVGVGLAVFAMWLLLHPYWGLKHDAILYTYSALARVHPESLAQDVFLRFGSQDQYSLFGPIYAAAVRLFGLEPAAAILTFVAQIAFFGAAWVFIRRLMSVELALLSIGLLMVLPSGYGAYQVFQYTEEFLTPREFAEAFVLFGLAAALARRHVLAWAALLAAMLIHPVMAAAGVAMTLTLQVAIPRPKIGLALAAAGAALLFAGAILIPFGPLTRIDNLWFDLISDRSAFLFVRQWSVKDWAQAVVPLGVLAVGLFACREPLVRRLCGASLIIAACGLALTLIGADVMRILIVTQAQPWRWLWLSSAIAVLLMPLIARDTWTAGPLARTATALMATAWIFRGEGGAIIVAALAVAAAAASTRTHSVEPRRVRLVYLAALGIVIVALLINVGNTWLAAMVNPIYMNLPGSTSPIVQRVRLIAADGIAPAAILVLLWWVARDRNMQKAAVAATIAALVACIAIVPTAWRSWSAQEFPDSLYAKYAKWRQLMPVGTEVFWDAEPLGPSYLLERPSYISKLQTAGLVFSRSAALEMLDRTKRMRPLYWSGQFDRGDREWAAKNHPLPDLRAACRGSAVDFVVSQVDLKEPALATLAPNAQRPNVRMRLYRCADFRN